MQFKPGDVVVLKSGGPHMTVVSLEGGGCNCEWFDQSGRQSGNFLPATLEEVTDNSDFFRDQNSR